MAADRPSMQSVIADIKDYQPPAPRQDSLLYKTLVSLEHEITPPETQPFSQGFPSPDMSAEEGGKCVHATYSLLGQPSIGIIHLFHIQLPAW